MANEETSKKDFHVEKLVEEHGKDISGIVEKLLKSYSSERYKDFQKDVEEIVGRYLKSVLGWAVLVWLISMVASMLLQKVFNIF
ncbi:MAG: hypothetical protein ABI430_02585 [Candidatus Taylorbacteria bacterium]